MMAGVERRSIGCERGDEGVGERASVSVEGALPFAFCFALVPPSPSPGPSVSVTPRPGLVHGTLGLRIPSASNSLSLLSRSFVSHLALFTNLAADCLLLAHSSALHAEVPAHTITN